VGDGAGRGLAGEIEDNSNLIRLRFVDPMLCHARVKFRFIAMSVW
jgi:hypothetical protein